MCLHYALQAYTVLSSLCVQYVCVLYDTKLIQSLYTAKDNLAFLLHVKGNTVLLRSRSGFSSCAVTDSLSSGFVSVSVVLVPVMLGCL